MRTLLILAANPKGTARLRLDEEVKKIEQGLERSKKREQFKLVVKWAVTDDDLRRAMLDNEPEIVHFAGHGKEKGRGGKGRDLFPAEGLDSGGLAFEDDGGNVQLTSGDALARLFELCADSVKCVVLNACYSEPQANAISQHIDYVVGMKKAIGDQAAIKFAVGFYDALGAGRDFERAFKFGCSAIDLKGIPGHLTPVLKTRSTPGPSLSSATGTSSSAGKIGNRIDQPVETVTPTSEASSALEGKSMAPVSLFYSYSHADESLRDELANHLALLRREKLIAPWHDRNIDAGDEWKGEIDKNLEEAQVILLLISASFMASDYCNDIEMDRAMARHGAGTARVIPVILRSCDWQSSRFARLKMLPKDGKPVTLWADRDEAFTDVAKGIRQLVKEITTNPR
jgi:TIR domain/CHAT domain